MRTVTSNERYTAPRTLNESELESLKPYILHLMDAEIRASEDPVVAKEFVAIMATTDRVGNPAANEQLKNLYQRASVYQELQSARQRFSIQKPTTNSGAPAFYLRNEEEEKLQIIDPKDNPILERIAKICTENLTPKLIVTQTFENEKIVNHKVLEFKAENSQLIVKYTQFGPLNSFNVALNDLEAHYPKATSSGMGSRPPQYKPNNLVKT